MITSTWRRAPIVLTAAALLLTACAGDRFHREGMRLFGEGKPEQGLAELAKAVEAEPTSAAFRKDLQTARERLVELWIAEARSAVDAGLLDDADARYRRVLAIEPGNMRARVGLEELVRDKRHDLIFRSAHEAYRAGDADKALALLRPLLAENPDATKARELKREIDEQTAKRFSSEPNLAGARSKPVNLEFRDANVRMVFEGMARTTGINFILDKDVRPDLRTTVFLKNAAVEDAVDLILRTSQLQKKVLNANTVLVYPNTPEKIKDYQELVVKAFYLQTADAKQVQNSLKTLLKSKDVVVDEKLNLIVMRDTPDAIRLAEKLVAVHDIVEPEVMLEVEVLEVQRSRLLNLGIQWPNQLTLTPLAGGTGGLTFEDLRNQNSSRTGVSIASTVVNLRRDLTDANILANPRIRARNREKAKIMIGDRVPVVTTTTTATGLVSDSVQYLDVGLKLEVEPDIHLQDDVAIKIGLEVSSLVKEVRSPSGTLSYQVGTRNANTVLRLRNGETQILAGLINDQDRRSASGVPGLVDLPVVGRLFGSQQDNRDKTEIVLSITPRIVRNVVRPDANTGEFWSGTESSLRTRPLGLTPYVAPAPSSSDSTKGRIESAEVSNNRPSPSISAKTAVLSLRGPQQVKVGETFKVVVRLKTDGGVRSLPFQAAFDTKAFQVVEVVEGEFFKKDGGATSFSRSVDVAGGKILVTALRSDVDGASGDDVVATVSLRALAATPAAEVRVLVAAPLGQDNSPPRAEIPPPLIISVIP